MVSWRRKSLLAVNVLHESKYVHTVLVYCTHRYDFNILAHQKVFSTVKADLVPNIG